MEAVIGRIEAVFGGCDVSAAPPAWTPEWFADQVAAASQLRAAVARRTAGTDPD